MKNAWLERQAARRLGVLLLLGFSSGLPLALTGGTLQAWFTVAGLDLVSIGLLGLVEQPYVFKFLWAPLMDRYVLPGSDRRRGWIFITQLGLLATIVAMASLSPTQAPIALSMLAFSLAFLSASQDIAIDAYRTDLLRPAERGLGAAVSVTGYRVAMIVSGGLALILADRIGWQETYLTMAGLVSVGIIGCWLGPAPTYPAPPPSSLRTAVADPFREFLSRPMALSLLLLIVLYKLADAFAGTLSTAFLIRGAGFTPTDVGVVNKGLGLLCTLGGVFVGGVLLARLGLFLSLFAFGVLQGVTNLGFLVLALAGRDYLLLVFVVGMENFAGGLGVAAFVALLMSLCDHRYSATQFALFSAIAASGRVFLGPIAGLFADRFGWPSFFVLTTLAALPGLWVLWRLKAVLELRDGDGPVGRLRAGE